MTDTTTTKRLFRYCGSLSGLVIANFETRFNDQGSQPHVCRSCRLSFPTPQVHSPTLTALALGCLGTYAEICYGV